MRWKEAEEDVCRQKVQPRLATYHETTPTKHFYEYVMKVLKLSNENNSALLPSLASSEYMVRATISNPIVTEDPTRSRTTRRIIDIQNLEKLAQQSSEPHCPDHAHDFVPDCNEVVNETKDKDTHHVPDALKQVENTTPIFQYHFGKGARPGDPEFNLDAVIKPTTQPLLSLPAPQPTTPPSDTLQQTTSTVRNHNINAE
ncbi:hypothetical protein Tco_0692595 [Tanacetum coccineum]